MRVSAEASDSGLPQISPPIRSAEYSRVRLIIAWISIAAMGAKIAASSVPIIPIQPLSRPPPKNMPNCASIDIAPATVAATVIVSVSRFLM